MRELVSMGVSLAARHSVDAVWASDPTFTLCAGCLVSSLTGKPLFVSYQSGPTQGSKVDGRTPVLHSMAIDRLLETWACRRALCSLCFTKEQAKYFEAMGVPTRTFRNTPLLDFFLRVQPSPSGDFAFVGFTGERKDPLGAIRAHKIYQSHGGRRRLRFFSEGPLLAACKAEAEGYDGIDFMGFVPQERLAWEFSSCVGLVHPSTNEGFSNAIMEAQAAGLVPIVANLDNIKLGMASDACLTFTPGSPTSLAERMLELDADPGKRQELSQKAKSDLTRWWAEGPDLHNRRVFEEFLGALDS